MRRAPFSELLLSDIHTPESPPRACLSPGELRADDRWCPLSGRESKHTICSEILAVGIGHLGRTCGQEGVTERESSRETRRAYARRKREVVRTT